MGGQRANATEGVEIVVSSAECYDGEVHDNLSWDVRVVLPEDSVGVPRVVIVVGILSEAGELGVVNSINPFRGVYSSRNKCSARCSCSSSIYSWSSIRCSDTSCGSIIVAVPAFAAEQTSSAERFVGGTGETPGTTRVSW